MWIACFTSDCPSEIAADGLSLPDLVAKATAGGWLIRLSADGVTSAKCPECVAKEKSE